MEQIPASNPSPLRRLGRFAGESAIALVLSLGILVCLTEMWKVDLSIPFSYYWDGVLTGTLIKGTIDNGWFLYNPYIGVPAGRELFDFPFVDNLHLLFLKLIGSWTGDFAITYNLYFLLCFPLTTLTAFAVLRRLQLGFGPAVVAALLYTFLPYPFWRCAAGHLFLASYYLVPLITLVILWVFRDDLLVLRADPQTGLLRWRIFGLKTWIGILVCLLVSSAGVYYAFFACFFLVVAGLSSGLTRRRVYPLVNAAVMIAAVGIGVLANISPTLWHKWQHGSNPEAVARCPQGAEIHGLKITQLFLPVTEHRWRAFREFKATYNSITPVVNENDWATLGVVGSVGILLLCGRFLYRRTSLQGIKVMDALSILTVAGLLLATIGGFGSLFSFLVSDWIRGYARIVVYLAFFAFFAVAWLLQKLALQWTPGTKAGWLYVGVLGVILGVGIADQTNRKCKPPFEWAFFGNAGNFTQAYRRDAAYFRQVEQSLPADAWVFQLPYVPYPEHPPVLGMTDYDHFRGYLHTHTLRWSYGAIRGRDADTWQRQVAALPPEGLVKALAFAGFQGVHVDRAGFADRAADLEAKLTALLPGQRIESDDKRFLFFPLNEYVAGLRQQLSEQEWTVHCEHERNPVCLRWEGGFYRQEGLADHDWRWCSEKGVLKITNPSAEPRRVRMKMKFATAQQQPADLWIEGSILSAELAIGPEPREYAATLVVPPGEHVVRFRTSAKRVRFPGDSRDLHFCITDFSLRDTDEAPATPVALSP
jgi:phosphoglycerol transferase